MPRIMAPAHLEFGSVFSSMSGVNSLGLFPCQLVLHQTVWVFASGTLCFADMPGFLLGTGERPTAICIWLRVPASSRSSCSLLAIESRLSMESEGSYMARFC